MVRTMLYKSREENECYSETISIFLPSLNGGGAERVVVTLANGIAKRGFRVDLVLANANGTYLQDVSPAVRIVDLKAGRVIKALLPLASYLKREKPRAMLSAMNHANVVAIAAKTLAGVSIHLVVSEHNTISVEHTRAKGWFARTTFMLVRRLYARANGICTVSAAASQDLAQFIGISPSQIQTIYNPFDLGKIQRLSMQPVEHPWLQADQPPVLLGIGRLTPQKDFNLLIHAFAKLRQQRTVRLLILGEGPHRQELEALSQTLGLGPDDVALPGFVDNPYAYMKRCAAFVLSSQWEGLPTVLIEAMACGSAVVSTNCPSGPAEILEDGLWGRLVPVGDATALSRAIADTLDMPSDKCPNVRVRAADFEQERAVDAYLQLLGLPLHPDAPSDSNSNTGQRP